MRSQFHPRSRACLQRGSSNSLPKSAACWSAPPSRGRCSTWVGSSRSRRRITVSRHRRPHGPGAQGADPRGVRDVARGRCVPLPSRADQRGRLQGLPKEARSELHERHAAWLVSALGSQVGETEELLGYHFEQAYRYRAELGLADAKTARVGRPCLLGASARPDGWPCAAATPRAAVNLLERALSPPSTDEPACLEMGLDLGSLSWLAASSSASEAVLTDVIERAREAGGVRHGAPRLVGTRACCECSTGRIGSTLRKHCVKPRSRSRASKRQATSLRSTTPSLVPLCAVRVQ